MKRSIKVKVNSITNYGSQGITISINVSDSEYKYSTNNKDVAVESTSSNKKAKKNAINYLVACCLLHNEYDYSTFEIIK